MEAHSSRAGQYAFPEEIDRLIVQVTGLHQMQMQTAPWQVNWLQVHSLLIQTVITCAI
jgi:hypothetical protein